MTHYEILGLSENASAASIRSTYLRLVQIYHPDHNSDPAAHRKTAEIIEAYSVLGDPQRRAEYDASLSGATQPPPQARQPDVERKELEPVVCRACGRQDASLRIAVFYWVASFLVVTQRGVKSGLWCERCRAKQAALWSMVSGVFGWWGFPWGPIYTVPALYHNAKGGRQTPKDNAALLRLVGFQLFQRGKLGEALAALDSSLGFEKDEDSRKFSDALRAMPGSFAPRRLPVFRILAAAPSVTVVVALLVAIIAYSSQPSGYEARFEGTKLPDSPAIVSKPKSSDAKDKVNALVDELAESVRAHATPAGSHQEGATTINDYELNRAKYAAEPFEKIASEIAPFTGDGAANGDGFASSAYFNSRLMALSVSILNDFDAGRDISVEITDVRNLGNDERVQPWLANSKYDSSFKALNIQLKYMLRQQRLGVSRSQSELELKTLDGKIRSAKNLVESARASANADDKHRWVKTYNDLVDAYNSNVKGNKRARIAYEKVDLAFNRCFDSSILMSKFQQVNLTTSAQTVDALPTE